MVRVKYSEEAEPLLNKHFGFTFQPNNYGQSMLTGSRSSRTRYNHQFQRMQNLQHAIQFWRDMSPATKAIWNTFAATYPQPSKRNPAVFLSGYQLFLKRNHYLFLNYDVFVPFMESPVMETLSVGTATFEIKAGDNVIDMTDLYIMNFGIIPSPGQMVLFMAVPYSTTSGQFFSPILDILEILETPIDGFFCNVVLPDNIQNITFSVYLSKPISPGQSYVGTKVRYMGCFCTTKFTELTDVPSDYTGQAGKVPVVNEAEDGLEWGEGGGGGLTCADLAACPTIIAINEDIDNIYLLLSSFLAQSFPPINLGLLYNWFVGNDLRNICAEGWDILTYAQCISISTFLGGNSIAGGKLKQTALTFWQTPNSGANNTAKTNLRGSGQRQSNGTFSGRNLENYCWCKDGYSPTMANVYNASYGDTIWSNVTGNKKNGHSLRPYKLVTTLSEGQSGVYYGNNGNVYRTICVAGFEILADNLAETLWRDGTPISEVTIAASWAALSDSAMCAYDNNWAYVYL